MYFPAIRFFQKKSPLREKMKNALDAKSAEAASICEQYALDAKSVETLLFVNMGKNALDAKNVEALMFVNMGGNDMIWQSLNTLFAPEESNLDRDNRFKRFKLGDFASIELYLERKCTFPSTEDYRLGILATFKLAALRRSVQAYASSIQSAYESAEE